MRDFFGWTWLVGIAGLASMGSIFVLLLVAPAIYTGRSFSEMAASHMHPAYGLATIVASLGVLIGTLRSLNYLLHAE